MSRPVHVTGAAFGRHTMEPGQTVLEALAGESYTLQPVDLAFAAEPVVLVSGPATVDGASITFTAPGEAVVDVRFAFGGRRLTFLVFEQTALDKVPVMQRSGRTAPRNAYERRLRLRAYATYGSVRSGVYEHMRTSDWHQLVP